ncbi:hypothetical protein SSX86_000113 [Deinandra increscens subsp. villosa]|uniref:Cycloidea-like protein n=1 Tax=Deinandra increscens subsp. villosa TaxID=3103831 RepID=A0AAP0HF02_9ASTR
MYPSSLYNYISDDTNLWKTHQEGDCLPLPSPFQLPTPPYTTLEDGRIFNELLQQELHLSNNHSNHINGNNFAVEQQLASLQSPVGKCSNNNGDDGSQSAPDGSNKPTSSKKRRRASESKRHSKINTARGPRDRRMRLSLDVGKKFFKLQDLLGFDKASKTVEWLLLKSKSNIQELISHSDQASTSKCEYLAEYINEDRNGKSSSSSNPKGKKKTRRGVRKSCYLIRPLAKETREMARKRARERTLEKSSNKLACVSGAGDDQLSKFRPCLDQTMEPGTNRASSWIINQPEPPSSHFHLAQGVIDDNPSSMVGSWNPSFMFNCPQTGVHPREHQFSDFHILGNL